MAANDQRLEVSMNQVDRLQDQVESLQAELKAKTDMMRVLTLERDTERNLAEEPGRNSSDLVDEIVRLKKELEKICADRERLQIEIIQSLGEK